MLNHVMNNAVFLDKDGTLIRDVPYNIDPEQITILPGVIEGLQRLAACGYLAVVITNQAGIAKGFFTELEFGIARDYLITLFKTKGITIHGFYYCPHHKEGVVKEYSILCECRKPKPGLLYRAARELHIDLSRSWLIGDSKSDMEAAIAAGCNTILLTNKPRTSDVYDIREVNDLNAAADCIVSQGRV